MRKIWGLAVLLVLVVGSMVMATEQQNTKNPTLMTAESVEGEDCYKEPPGKRLRNCLNIKNLNKKKRENEEKSKRGRPSSN